MIHFKSCPNLAVGDHYSFLSYLALRPVLCLQPYCRIGASMDFGPYSVKIVAS
uniref:Uncharacterized protein n=1 Tax=Utricularia reniformis TaxID=192314 RepID=A0A1Y0AZ75_9LAMI|nr:hypothetical protein AEK19_MT0195 [Utricularia reniformis]ART30475.1 hypothetical protein AEK19_MT0195 [Utricularia reniformis]